MVGARWSYASAKTETRGCPGYNFGPEAAVGALVENQRMAFCTMVQTAGDDTGT